MTYHDLKNLSSNDLEEIFQAVSNILAERNEDGFDKEDHLAKGVVCPFCGSVHCVKNGKSRGKQRFLCKDCNKTFGVVTSSPLSGTKIEYAKWIQYIKCMMSGMSIRAGADVIGVTVKTSFYMRHRILESMEHYVTSTNEGVSGIAELDGTYLAESFKGNHTNSKGFNMPRRSHKRGKDVKIRGLSHEMICIATAIDRDGSIIMEPIGRGRVATNTLCSFYDGKIKEGTTLCTDGFRAYSKLAENNGFVHKKIVHGKTNDAIFNLSRINGLHSRFKKWIKTFNGVSTKYLPHYLAWFQWIEKNKGLTGPSKSKAFWKDAMFLNVDARIDTIREKSVAF